jgi:hypothetical protein
MFASICSFGLMKVRFVDPCNVANYQLNYSCCGLSRKASLYASKKIKSSYDDNITIFCVHAYPK